MKSCESHVNCRSDEGWQNADGHMCARLGSKLGTVQALEQGPGLRA